MKLQFCRFALRSRANRPQNCRFAHQSCNYFDAKSALPATILTGPKTKLLPKQGFERPLPDCEAIHARPRACRRSAACYSSEDSPPLTTFGSGKTPSTTDLRSVVQGVCGSLLASRSDASQASYHTCHVRGWLDEPKAHRAKPAPHITYRPQGGMRPEGA